ncbi:phosphatidylserine decarboxylase [Halalkalibacter alkaliphilus]|uniref:Phosphatidylserine decarboxylase proenzyme n=1 Tax=Halalkalibacter alkaliphilus TaxID=2917993 RepID=A0A9X1ZY71_9BACI|nr:phosphatidylserine decarboxylase [Halalkalibacter alkaliphilus]MCL7746898.1 phosphatidylserine decarboxylase [Halalkalibacter alkaliphilus]
MKKLLFRSCIELTNHRLTSSALRNFSRSKISKPLVKPFARTFHLNDSEMKRPLNEYVHLHDLFIRELKPGSRPIDKNTHSLISPVDGIMAQHGDLRKGTVFHVKGQDYNIEEMLGSAQAAEPYLNGHYFILYLSPSHYHRIHCPVDGIIKRQWQLGGRSYPVNTLGLRYGKRPLSRNYRVISELDVNGKHLAIVKVGAMNINTIELTHNEERLYKGDEMAYFSFGSTVVLLCENGLLSQTDIEENSEVRVGEKIALLNQKETTS